MIYFSGKTKFFMKSTPTDMRKGYEGLASIVRDVMGHNMFGLLESCKLNKVNFGEYIEDILTRKLCGEEVDASFLPCDYVLHFEYGTDAEVTKTSQAVA